MPGLVIGKKWARDATGFSTYTLGAGTFGFGSGYNGTGTRIIFCSMAGNDAWDGSAPAFVSGTTGPIKSPLVANSLVRDALGNAQTQGDWVLYRRGDTFDIVTMPHPGGVQLRYSGPNFTYPILQSNYDPNTFNMSNPIPDDPTSPLLRPIFLSESQSPNGGAVFSGQFGAGAPADSGSNIALIGLVGYAHKRDPNGPDYVFDAFINGGFSFISSILPSFANMLCENCAADFFPQGFSFGPVPGTSVGSNLIVRRCNSTNAYLTVGNGTAGFHPGSLVGVRNEENFWDHNGWIQDPTMRFLCSPSSPTPGDVYTEGATFTGRIDNGTPGTPGNILTVSSVVGTIFASNPDAYPALVAGSGVAAGTFIAVNLGGGQYSLGGAGNPQNLSARAMCSGTTYTVQSPAMVSGALMTTTAAAQWPKDTFGTLQRFSGTGDAAISFSQISNTASGNLGFTHNFYVSAFGEEFDDASLCTFVTCDGNIVSRDPSGCQGRSGGSMQNSLWIQNPYPTTVALPNPDQSDITTVSYNVVTEAQGRGWNAQNYENGLQVGVSSGPYARGSVPTISNNIHTHTSFSTNPDGSNVGGEGIENDGGTYTLTQNIFYKWNSPCLNMQDGAILTMSVTTPGTGASAMPSVTGFIDDASGAHSTSTVTNGTGSKTFVVPSAVAAIATQPLYILSNTSTVNGGGTNTYTSGTGVISLTFNSSSLCFANGDTVTLALSGSGTNLGALQGNWACTGVSGTTATFAGPAGQGTITITGGNAQTNLSMQATVTSFSSGTMVVNVSAATGTATCSDWQIMGAYSGIITQPGATDGYLTITSVTGGGASPLWEGVSLSWPGQAGPACIYLRTGNWPGLFHRSQMYVEVGAQLFPILVAPTTFTMLNYAVQITGGSPTIQATGMLKISAGGVSSIYIYDSHNFSEDPHKGSQAGSGYTVGTVLGATLYDGSPIPGLSGFSATVSTVSVSQATAAWFDQSISSVTVGAASGTRAFLTQPGNGYFVGQSVTATSRGTPSASITGTVASFIPNTLTINVTGVTGSGTFSDWDLLATNSGANGNVCDRLGKNFVGYPDPERTVTRYMREVMGVPGATTADFLVAAKANYKNNWDYRLTADAVNQWIGAGFGVTWPFSPATSSTNPPSVPNPHKHHGNRGHIHSAGDWVMVR